MNFVFKFFETIPTDFWTSVQIPEYYKGCEKNWIPNTEYYLVLRKSEYQIQILLFGPTIWIVFEYRIIRHTLFPPRMSNLYKYWTSNFGKWGQKDVKSEQTDGQTDARTRRQTFCLIESIGPEGRCFENKLISKQKNY